MQSGNENYKVRQTHGCSRTYHVLEHTMDNVVDKNDDRAVHTVFYRTWYRLVALQRICANHLVLARGYES